MKTSANNPTRRYLALWLLKQTAPLLPKLVFSVCARIVGQLLDIALLVLAMRAITDVATHPTDNPRLAPTITTLVIVALLKAFLRYVEHYFGHYVAFTSLQRLRELYYERLIPQTPAILRKRHESELTDLGTQDIDRIEVFYAHTIPPAISAIIVPTIALIWTATHTTSTISLTLALFTIITIAVIPLLTTITTWKNAQHVAHDRADIAEECGDTLAGMREILAFNDQAHRTQILTNTSTALIRALSREGALEGLRASLTLACHLGSCLAVVLIAAHTPDPLTAIPTSLAVAIGLWGPTRGIEDFMTSLDASFAATSRLHAVVEGKPTINTTTSTPDRHMQAGAASIELRNVSFSYTDTTRTLTALSLHIPAGTWHYIVGVSGSGKSTISHLLLRGWDPSQGCILLDGQPLTTYTLDTLRSTIMLAPQHPILLSGTLADNLRLMAPHAPEEDLWEALTIVRLQEWAASLHNGLHTPLHATGRSVSGGQLQRIALARVIVGKPRLIIIDEALSQIDTETADDIRTRLRTWAGQDDPHAPKEKQRTVLEITHRVDRIPNNAHVTVLDQGHIVDEGSAGILREQNGPFRQLEARV